MAIIVRGAATGEAVRRPPAYEAAAVGKPTARRWNALKKAGTQTDWLDQMQTRQELYDLLDYDPAAEEWKGFRD